MGENILIYGAYGYTGSLIVDLAVKKGWRPMVAGRNRDLIRSLAEKYDLKFACFPIHDQKKWDEALAGKDLLMNCAGPFSLTIEEILPACIRNKTNYTDINGEIDVFNYIQNHDLAAKEVGITLLPGIGFDVVPTDCLARFLYEKLPSATHLELAFEGSSGLSRGTALSVLNRFGKGSAFRQDGEIIQCPLASIYKKINYGGKDRLSVCIAWGDVFTAFYTTGIPNIKVFTGMPARTFKALKRASKLTGLIKTRLVQWLGRYYIRKNITGPVEEIRESYRSYIWGRVYDEAGNQVIAEIETPESYKLTAIAAVLCAEKIMAGEAKPGFITPAGAFGADLIMEVDGVVREIVLNK